MLLRFCLYGFLKNLRPFDAFLVLALLERGLSFAAIGGLIAVREVVGNLLDIPSGALADGLGRKRCMVTSMAAYACCFPLLALAEGWWALAGAMILFGTGDAFRSGTHKAMIWTWLRAQGREAERSRIYGLTRSWSLIGSALAALLGGAAVIAGGSYTWVFWAACVPTLANLVNLATYPAWLDRDPGAAPAGWAATVASLRDALVQMRRRPALRRLVAGSMTMEGLHGAAKGYLPPLLAHGALTVPLALSLSGEARGAALVALVATALFLLAALASRRAHRGEAAAGGAASATRILAWTSAAIWAALAPALLAGWWWAAAALLAAQTVLLNLWRPIQIARYDEAGDERLAATTLSIESQATGLATALAAPLLGWAVDAAGGAGSTVALWPLALLAAPVALAALLSRPAPAPRG
jgi:MFS family permease